MKLVLAIVHDRDKHKLTDRLLQQGLTFTQIGSTGGFLRQGNVTLLMGVENDSVDLIFELLRSACGSVEKFVNVPTGDVVTSLSSVTLFPVHPVKVSAGGAVAFVLNVERFEKF